METTLKFKGLKFVVPKETECFWPYYGICFVGEYDPILINIKGSDIVLDAGANVGIFTLLASKKAKKIIAVEPDPENFSYLVKNIYLNGAKNVVSMREALSDYVGKGYLSGKGLSAALSQNHGIPVKVTTIDDMLRRLHVTHVDVVKVDIEGAEVKALKGEFLSKVRELMIEVHGRQNNMEVYKILKAKGFTIKEWNFSPLISFKKILKNFMPFLNAEFKTHFVAIRLILRCAFGLSPHPVPAAEKDSNVKLIYAHQTF